MTSSTNLLTRLVSDNNEQFREFIEQTLQDPNNDEEIVEALDSLIENVSTLYPRNMHKDDETTNKIIRLMSTLFDNITYYDQKELQERFNKKIVEFYAKVGALRLGFVDIDSSPDASLPDFIKLVKNRFLAVSWSASTFERTKAMNALKQPPAFQTASQLPKTVSLYDLNMKGPRNVEEFRLFYHSLSDFNCESINQLAVLVYYLNSKAAPLSLEEQKTIAKIIESLVIRSKEFIVIDLQTDPTLSFWLRIIESITEVKFDIADFFVERLLAHRGSTKGLQESLDDTLKKLFSLIDSDHLKEAFLVKLQLELAYMQEECKELSPPDQFEKIRSFISLIRPLPCEQFCLIEIPLIAHIKVNIPLLNHIKEKFPLESFNRFWDRIQEEFPEAAAAISQKIIKGEKMSDDLPLVLLVEGDRPLKQMTSDLFYLFDTELRLHIPDLDCHIGADPRVQSSSQHSRFKAFQEKEVLLTIQDIESKKPFLEILYTLAIDRRFIGMTNRNQNWQRYGAERSATDYRFSTQILPLPDHRKIVPHLQLLVERGTYNMKGMIPGREAPVNLTSYDSKETKWNHPALYNWPAIKTHLSNLYEELLTIDPENREANMIIIAKILWWLCQTCPFDGGTAAIAEILMPAFLQAKGITPSFNPDIPPIDLLALSMVEEDFITFFSSS